MDNFYNYGKQVGQEREIINRHQELLKAAREVLNGPAPCTRCRSLENIDKVREKQLGDQYIDLRELRLACQKVFETKGYDRFMALGDLLRALNNVYGRKAIRGWNNMAEQDKAELRRRLDAEKQFNTYSREFYKQLQLIKSKLPVKPLG